MVRSTRLRYMEHVLRGTMYEVLRITGHFLFLLTLLET